MTIHTLATLNSSTSTRLTPNGAHSGMDITLQNVNASGSIYIGGEDLALNNYGYRIMPDTAISFELPGKDALYAMSEVDGMLIAILQTGLETQG